MSPEARNAIAKIARQKKVAAKTFHSWEPWDKPLVARNPNPNAPPSEKYVVLENVKYRNAMMELAIPKGMLTDLGSIPTLFTNLISPDGRGFRAFLAHDAIYRRQEVARVIADALLLSILREDGVNRIQAYVIYYAVRIFGERAWEENRKRLFDEKATRRFDA